MAENGITPPQPEVPEPVFGGLREQPIDFGAYIINDQNIRYYYQSIIDTANNVNKHAQTMFELSEKTIRSKSGASRAKAIHEIAMKAEERRQVAEAEKKRKDEAARQKATYEWNVTKEKILKLPEVERGAIKRVGRIAGRVVAKAREAEIKKQEAKQREMDIIVLEIAAAERRLEDATTKAEQDLNRAQIERLDEMLSELRSQQGGE